MMTTRKETKQQAQAELMSTMQIAFAGIPKNPAEADVTAEMSRQMERVEKLFGYEPGSWVRGV